MDPQACLKELFDALFVGDLDEARYKMFHLATWIDKGGFCPIVTPDMIEPVLARRRQMED